MGGYNNNPTAKQIASAYKKLLVHNEVKSSAKANCIPQDDTNILTVSSRRIEAEPDIIEINNNCDIDNIKLDDMPLYCIETRLCELVLYVAGFVERRVLKKLKCDICVDLLNKCEASPSLFINTKSKGYL